MRHGRYLTSSYSSNGDDVLEEVAGRFNRIGKLMLGMSDLNLLMMCDVLLLCTVIALKWLQAST